MADRNMSNFLATDKVPDTIFGIPVVSRREDYTESDLAFFRDHPEAGGYYDMGEDEDKESQGAVNSGPSDLRTVWSDAVRKSGDLVGLAKVFYAMSGEQSLTDNGVPADAIANSHLARLLVHTNRMNQRRGNPANRGRTYTPTSTVSGDSQVLSRYAWGEGPGANWFDVSKMEPRFDVIERSPQATEVARSLIENGVKYLGETLSSGLLPSDATYYGDGTGGLTSDAIDIGQDEVKIGALPPKFRIGRKKGAK